MPTPADARPASDPFVTEHRTKPGSVAAIVFLHGFAGGQRGTWGNFPRFLSSDRRLKDWDVLSVGYPSTLLLPDIAGLWSAQPPLVTVSDLLATRCAHEPLNHYRALALIAHSMGGLVVQRALVDRPQLARRVTHVLLFGTPSFGLRKASIFKFWKRQIRDMCIDGAFITDLRARWDSRVDPPERFRFLAVAGDTDEFVPRESSLDGFAAGSGFPTDQQMVVPGNHLQIVKPDSAGQLSVRVAIQFLTGGDAHINSAFAAAERAAFRQTAANLGAAAADLDDEALVKLALALEALGRQPEAIRVLEAAPHKGTDVLGALAGRLKRRWLLERAEADAESARRLYGEALDRAIAEGNHSQAFYHAINVAFMELAHRQDLARARSFARQALAHTEQAPHSCWRHATRGEAAIVLGDGGMAIDAYGEALHQKPTARETDSMYRQASFELDLMNNEALAKRLHAMFVEQATV